MRLPTGRRSDVIDRGLGRVRLLHRVPKRTLNDLPLIESVERSHFPAPSRSSACAVVMGFGYELCGSRPMTALDRRCCRYLTALGDPSWRHAGSDLM